MKRVCCLASVILLLVLASVGAEGKVLNIACWNDEFSSRFERFYASKLPDDIKVHWIVMSTENDEYQSMLDENLPQNKSVPADSRIDLFLVEPDYAKKYVDSNYILDVRSDVGLTDDDLSQQFAFTNELMTDSNGALKGVAWLMCPSGFVYRRSYARKVLGTDDPAKVQSMIDNWDACDDVAAKMADSGYRMVSGYDDTLRAFLAARKTPWLVDGELTVDPSVERWIEQTKMYTAKGYNNGANLWSNGSEEGMKSSGNVFGYFGPAWYVDFVLTYFSRDDMDADAGPGNGSYGDWAICKGPQGFNWGGSYICVAAGTDNLKVIKDILQTFTCDDKTMMDIALQTGDIVNNKKVMDALADYPGANRPFLGGKNPIGVYIEAANSFHGNNLIANEREVDNTFLADMTYYFTDFSSEDEAWSSFRGYLFGGR